MLSLWTPAHPAAQVNKILVDDKGTVLLCVFGLPPRPHSDDPLRAVRTALLLSSIFSGQKEGSGHVLADAKACIGVSSGRAFCGVVGSTNRREFTVMGDVVNVSARLMGMASQPGAESAVYVDEDTMMQTRGRIEYKMLPPVKLKGKANLTPLCAPVKEMVEAKQGGSIGKQGRDFEFQQLRSMVAELLVYHNGGSVILIGGRGSGKNVLTKALGEFGKAADMLVLKSAFHSEDAVAVKGRKASVFPGIEPGSGKGLIAEGENAADTASRYLAWRDMIARLLDSLVKSMGGSKADVVRAALAAEEELLISGNVSGVGEGALSPRGAGGAPSGLGGLASLASRLGGLQKYAALVNELLPDGREPVFADEAPPDVMTTEDRALLKQSILLALLRLASRQGRVMILLQLVTGTSRDQDVDIWSWRAANAISIELSANRLTQVVMCIVTRQVNPSQDGWRETSGREIERLFSQLTAEAERTRSLLKLMPLSREARERYLLQVLQERYHFSGQLHDVPKELIQFMSERAAGNPKYIMESLQALNDAEHLVFDVDDRGDEGGGMVVRRVSLDTLRGTPAPTKMKATVLQQFDMLEPQLQRVLKLVSPLNAFSGAHAPCEEGTRLRPSTHPLARASRSRHAGRRRPARPRVPPADALVLRRHRRGHHRAGLADPRRGARRRPVGEERVALAAHAHARRSARLAAPRRAEESRGPCRPAPQVPGDAACSRSLGGPSLGGVKPCEPYYPRPAPACDRRTQWPRMHCSTTST